MSVGQRVFQTVQRLPDRTVPWVIGVAPVPLTVRFRNGRWWATDRDATHDIALTRAKDAPRFLVGPGGIDGRLEQLADRYQDEELGVVVDPGDRVIDCGAFLGEFALGVRDRASEIVCLEPDPRSYGALSATVADDETIQARQQAVWSSDDDPLRVMLGTDPSETSALELDDGRVVGAVDAETVTLDDIDADFAKIEAEGAGPEVLEGLESTAIPKLAVNCDPERGGENPRDAVVDRLEEIGYETVVVGDDGRTVYAKVERP
jgi:FkbM family methyltransferase